MASNLTAADRAELNELWDLLRRATVRVEQLLGDDDPTGLRYSRGDDEEPVATPVPPTVDGFHITGRNQRPTKQPEVFQGGSASGMGAVAVRAATVPTLRGGVR